MDSSTKIRYREENRKFAKGLRNSQRQPRVMSILTLMPLILGQLVQGCMDDTGNQFLPILQRSLASG